MLRILLVLVTIFIINLHTFSDLHEGLQLHHISCTKTHVDACISLVPWDSRSHGILLGSLRMMWSMLVQWSSWFQFISNVDFMCHMGRSTAWIELKAIRLNMPVFEWLLTLFFLSFFWCRSCNCRAIQDGLWFTLQLRGVDVPGLRSSWQRSKLLKTVCGVSKRPFVELRVWEYRLDLQLACGTTPRGVLQYLARQVGAIRLPLLQRLQLPQLWLQFVQRTCW